MIGADLMGPFVVEGGRKMLIFTATDYYTKWCEAQPIPYKEATTGHRKTMVHEAKKKKCLVVLDRPPLFFGPRVSFFISFFFLIFTISKVELAVFYR